MDFELSVSINRPVADVGTCYREVVQMLPSYRGEILSEITRFRENETIEEKFRGAGMHGHLVYEFRSEGEGTTLVQKEMLRYHAILRLFEPLISRILGRRLRDRLAVIKSLLENDSCASRDSTRG